MTNGLWRQWSAVGIHRRSLSHYARGTMVRGPIWWEVDLARGDIARGGEGNILEPKKLERLVLPPSPKNEPRDE